MKRIISVSFMAVLAVLLSALVFAPVSYAADADSSVSDTLVSQASSGSQNVSAAGNVFDLNGDDDFVHFSAVEGIIINGSTGGDIIGFSYSPVINASVGGSVRYAANIIEIKGDVARNITVLAMEMTSSGSSKGVYFAGGTLYFSGSTGTLSAQAEKVYLSGQVNGDINIEADSVEFLNGFSCTGKITLTAGSVSFGPVDRSTVTFNEITTGSAITAAILGLFYDIPVNIILAFIIMFVFRRSLVSVYETFNADKFKITFMGFAAAVCIPFIAVLLLLTFVGTTVSLVIAVIYALLYYLSVAAASVIIGGVYMPVENKYLASAATAAILTVLCAVPVLSYAVPVVCFLLTLGTIVRSVFSSRRTLPPPEYGGPYGA